MDSVTYTLGVDARLTNVGNTWTLNLGTAPAVTLADGTYEVTATLEDSFGNTASDGTANELIIDSSIPTAPTITGAPISTADTTPIITGTYDSTEMGFTFTVTVDGTTYTLGVDPELTVNGTGTWTLDLSSLAPVLADGTYQVVATMTDGGGNVSADVSANELTIDTTPPVAGDVVIDTSVIINQGNVASYVASGTCTTIGDTITVTIDDNNVGTPVDSRSGLCTDDGLGNGIFSFGVWDLSAVADSAVVGVADIPVTAFATDTVGNVGPVENALLVKDTTGASETVTVTGTHTNATTVVFTFTFDEDIDNFDLTDVNLVLTGTVAYV